MAIIPNAVTVGTAPQKRPSPLEQILVGLVSQAPGLAMQFVQNRQANNLQQQQIDVQRYGIQAKQQEAQAAATARSDAIANTLQGLRAQKDPTGKDPAYGDTLAKAFLITTGMHDAGLDASTINAITKGIVPPDAQAQLALAEGKLKLQTSQDEQQSDSYATAWLKHNGYIGADAPERLTGAAKTLQSIIQANEGKSINWMKEGLDFVTNRVGDSVSGSSLPFTVGANGNLVPVEQQGVSVEQAIAEWRSIVERSAPEGVRKQLLSALDSGAWQQKLTLEVAKRQVADMFSAGQIDEATVRSTLKGSFTSSEIDEIIKAAKRRSGPAR